MAKSGTWGTLSLVLGLIAIVLAFVAGGVGLIAGVCSCFVRPFGFGCAVGAIVLGIISLIVGRNRGSGIVGIILGILYFIISIVIAVLSLIFGLAIAGLGGLD